MKKTIKIMLTLALVIAALCVTASAATNGFYDIGSADNVAITAYAGTDTTAITSKEANVDADADVEAYYEGSDRLGVTYSAATAGEDYGVILVEGSSLPTASSAIYYINQEEAASTNVTFDVYPATIEATKAAMTLYISSSKADADLVSVPMSYVVGYEEVVTPSFTYGDIKADGAVDNKDKTYLSRYLLKVYETSGLPSDLSFDAGDVKKDGAVDNKDKTILSRYLLKVYDSLPQ